MWHSHIGVYVHFVWATWDRLPLLTGQVQRDVYRAIGEKCEELGAEVIALGGVEDHVHMLVRMPATLSVADMIGQIKGTSSHLVTHSRPGADGFFKWQGAYGAFSVSARHLEDVSAYKRNQREHHAMGTLIPAYEPDALHS